MMWKTWFERKMVYTLWKTLLSERKVVESVCLGGAAR